MTRLVVVFSIAAAACASTAQQQGSGAAEPTATEPAETVAPAEPALSPTAAEPFEGAFSIEPDAEAPAELSQFGRLVGTWWCTGEQRQPDGTFKGSPGATRWDWFYFGGLAIQDVWRPTATATTGAAWGTNLRMWDTEKKVWHVAWTTTAQAVYEHFTAQAEGADVVMTGAREARAPFPAHTAKITFHTITPERFLWRYEASAPGGSTWQEFSRMECTRKKDS